MAERLHPQSYAELRRLVQLHGAERVIAAAEEIAREPRKPTAALTTRDDQCPEVLSVAYGAGRPIRVPCVYQKGHSGSHRNCDRRWS